jgi:hypothetical protein
MILDLTKSEEKYNKNLEKNLENGIQHPILVHWHTKDPIGEAEVAAGIDIKNRYRICKVCEHFDNSFKICKNCKCFMPIKVQFKFFSCPIGKW